jgi:hypothetical protein
VIVALSPRCGRNTKDGSANERYGRTVEWSNDVTAADWWIDRLQPFSDHVVGSMVPAGFEAITRIFHPIEDREGRELRWSDVAAANQRVVHAQMQLHRIVSRAGAPNLPNNTPDAWWGSLPIRKARSLAAALASSGSGGPVWFGFTTIDSTFDQPATAELPAAGTPSRKYFLIRSTLAAIDEVCRFASDRPRDSPIFEAPTVWWPEDRSWYVFSDVDFAWSYVGGSSALVEAVEKSSELEAIRSDYDHRGTFDADTINTP